MKYKIIILVFLFTFIYSCGNGGEQKEASMVMEAAAPENTMRFEDSEQDRIDTPAERKVIKQGNIRFETSDLNKTESFLKSILDAIGGYIVNDHVYDSENQVTHVMVIRIPAARFDEFLNKISDTVGKFDTKSINVSDVTEEFIDVEARVKTNKELETRYRQLLAQAKSVEDMLAIEKEMRDLRTEIESIEGRLRYLRDQVSMSSLTIEFYQKTGASTGYSKKLGQALVRGWDFMLVFIIGVMHLWPFILIVAGVLFVTYRNTKKRRSKNQIAQQTSHKT